MVTDRSFCLPLVCFPPARPGGNPPLGHGWSRDGHGGAPRSRSRLVTSLRVGSRQPRRRASSPGLCRSPRRSRFLSDARLRDRSRGRSVRHVLEPPFDVPTGPDFDRVAGYVPVASLVTPLARPRGRVFVPTFPKACKARCRAVVPRRCRHQDRALAAAK